jgi:hypothetical protein
MTKKIISVFLVVSVLFALFATSFSASALVDTTITYGDFDGKNGVTTSDAVEVLKVSAMLGTINNEAAFKRCDINSDGVLTIYDARQILRACAGIATIQPQGEFSGFDGGGVFVDPAIAVEYFNIAVNKIKTEKPGFIRNEAVDIKGFKIGSVSLSGFTANESAQSVSDMIESMLVSESAPAPTLESFKDENCDNAMSVETESYVSKLSADEVLGVRCVDDTENGFLIIEIALPDCDLDSVGQTAIGDVLSAKILQENMDTIVGNVFGASEGGDTTRKTIKNCVLKAVIDKSDASVIEYTTSYTTETKIAKSVMGLKGGILSAELNDIEYNTAISVVYDITDKNTEA